MAYDVEKDPTGAIGHHLANAIFLRGGFNRRSKPSSSERTYENSNFYKEGTELMGKGILESGLVPEAKMLYKKYFPEEYSRNDIGSLDAVPFIGMFAMKLNRCSQQYCLSS